MDEPQHPRRRRTDLEESIAIYEFQKQIERIDKFIEDADPLMAYVKAEIIRNEKRAALIDSIQKTVLGAGVLFVLGVIGAWIIEKIKLDFGVRQ